MILIESYNKCYYAQNYETHVLTDYPSSKELCSILHIDEDVLTDRGYRTCLNRVDWAVERIGY